jgi:amino acid adenylation domain-containing protein
MKKRTVSCQLKRRWNAKKANMSDFVYHFPNLPPEQQAIRNKCFHPTGTFVEFPKEELDQSIAERFEKIVAKYRDRIAIKTTDQTLTYDELNRAVNRIAYAIREKCDKKNEPVALLLKQGASPVAAMIGLLKAGGTYVPLDPYYPRMRLEFMLRDSRANVVVTDSKNRSFARELARHASEFINIDKLDSALPTDDPDTFRSSDSLAYIIYTSGSTGQPKGVMQTDRNVLHEIMNYTNAARICHDDRLLLVSSPSFADAVRTIYATLLNGARLCLLDIKYRGLGGLADWLRQENITIYRSVPAVFRQFVSGLSRREAFPNLRLIYLAGDTVSRKDVELYKKHFSETCILINGLGTTEALTFRWYFIGKETQINDNNVPVGYEIQDKQALLLDDAGKQAGVDSVGEIAVKSRYLSPGYWGRPDLTKAAFTSSSAGADERIYRTGDIGFMRPDGCLEQRGRKDFQVKVRGYRIEVSEIETALLALASIKEALVVGRKDLSDEARLVAYIVPTPTSAPSVSALRLALSETLPDYMIPSAFVCLEALPLSSNGKLDRRALPDPGRCRPNLDTPFVAPTTLLEIELAQIWAEILDLDRVGTHDKFLDLGGDSLLAGQIISRVFRKLQVDLPVQSLFQAPAIAEMAAVITEHQAKKIGEPELERILAELESISDEKARQFLADATAMKEPGE